MQLCILRSFTTRVTLSFTEYYLSVLDIKNKRTYYLHNPPLSSYLSFLFLCLKNSVELRGEIHSKLIKYKHPAVEMYCLNNYYIRANTSRCQLCFSNPRQTFGCPGSGEQPPRLRGAHPSAPGRRLLPGAEECVL